MSDSPAEIAERAAFCLREAAAALAAAASPECAGSIAAIARALADALRAGRKVLVCGNGGSAAQSQHVAAELVVRLSSRRDRGALRVIALTTDTSILTACANDFSFDEVFARQVEALADPGDVVVGVSTSGNSRNVVRAFEAAAKRGAKTVLFTGRAGGELSSLADLAFFAPSGDTPRIQEVHLATCHAVCAIVEDLLFGPVP